MTNVENTCTAPTYYSAAGVEIPGRKRRDNIITRRQSGSFSGQSRNDNPLHNDDLLSNDNSQRTSDALHNDDQLRNDHLSFLVISLNHFGKQ